MQEPRDFASAAVDKSRAALSRMTAARDSASGRSLGPLQPLDTDGTRAVEAWFLGPKGENAQEFEQLVVEAIRDHVFWRRNYHPADPTHITEKIKRTAEYAEALGTTRDGLHELLAFLKKSVPFFSMRYQGHMNWDLTIPGMLGYFAAMLYNPNNVAFEGSTATTIIELLVGDDLCRMLGYTIPVGQSAQVGPPRPWGHITCDGTVANIEAMWSARNLKFYPLALCAAIKNESTLSKAVNLDIKLPTGGTRQFTKLNEWELLNLRPDDVLDLPNRILQLGIARQDLSDAVGGYSLQTLGIADFTRQFLAQVPYPVIFVPGTKHYSFPKAAAVLGIGARNLIDVPVDLDARQNIEELRTLLDDCLKNCKPVIAVVAVIGTTEESAIDPLKEIVKLREEYTAKGLVFHIHADAAWGGYHRSVINPPFQFARSRRAGVRSTANNRAAEQALLRES